MGSTNHRGTRYPSPSFHLNSSVFVFLLCVTAVLFIPSILSLTARIFRPNLVKKSWNFLNIVVVLFPLIFGFLSRNKNYDSNNEGHQNISRNEIQKSNRETPQKWCECSDNFWTRIFNPDRREISPLVAADDRWRFSDTTQAYAHRYSDSDRLRRRRSRKRVEEEGEGSDQSKPIHVDTLGNRAPPPPPSPPPLEAVHRRKPKRTYETPPPPSSPPQPPSPPPSTPPPQAVHRRKPKRTYESAAHKKRINDQVKNELENTKSPISFSAPPPPPPPPPMYSEKKSTKTDPKRGGANATKDFLTSLYHQRKKKQRQQSVDDFETLLQSPAHSLTSLPPPSPTPPPPPPPPRPPSVFQNLFLSKKGKSKKIISIPPPSVTAARASKSAAQIAPIVAREPPLPVKIGSFSSVEEKSGGESPLTGSKSHLIPIPPPPPPPPFKIPSWKFVVKGDHVIIGSMYSSSSGSSDLDDVESETSEASGSGCTPTAAGDGGAVAPLFCPSPDVNTKATVSIAKFRAGLKLQKANSLRQKQGLGLSNLGPETKPGPGTHQI